MTEHELKQIIRNADTAINREDFDTLINFYSNNATLVVKPDRIVTGLQSIRKSFAAIAEYFNHTLEVSEKMMKVIEGGDTALVIAESVVKAVMKNGDKIHESRKATYVFRKAADGKWLCVIDNSYGTDLLNNFEV